MSLDPKERAARKAAFQRMTPAEKVEYIFTYYKIPIILGAIVLYLLCSTVYRQITKKEIVLYLAYINVSIGDDLDARLNEGSLSAMGADPRKAEVSLYRGLYLSDDPSPEDHQYGYASRLKLMAAIESKELDAVLMNKEAYDILSQNGYLLDLTSLLSPNDPLYLLVEPHLTSNTVILQDNAIEHALNEAYPYQAVTEEIVNGIDVSMFPIFQQAGFQEPVYFGVMPNSPRLAAVTRYIGYLTASSK